MSRPGREGAAGGPAQGRPLRVAVMSFAHTHAATYVALLQQRPDVSLLTCDPGPHPAGELCGRALAETWGVKHVESYAELLAWEPDAVIVTAENSRHRELVEQAAAAGAHILCEKPLATTWEDGLAIERAVAAAGVVLMMAFPVRFASAFTRLQAAHTAGELGRLLVVRGSNNGRLPVERSWFADPALAGGGALVDHVVHLADLLDALLGSTATTVTALTNRVLHADRARAETAGLVSIGYADGVVATLDCSWSQPQTAPSWGGLRMVVGGTGGTVEVDVFSPAVTGLDSATGRPRELRYGPDLDEVLLATFLDAVRSGRQPQPDVHVGLRTLAIVLAAQESARTGRTVTLPG